MIAVTCHSGKPRLIPFSACLPVLYQKSRFFASALRTSGAAVFVVVLVVVLMRSPVSGTDGSPRTPSSSSRLLLWLMISPLDPLAQSISQPDRHRVEAER